MPKEFLSKRVNGISDETVREKTGKKWDEWFKVLDKAGARMMEHVEIGALTRERLGLTPWWSHTITVAYEQERGMRARQQRGLRSDVELSKTVNAPAAAVWAAWHDPEILARWLPDAPFEVTKETPPRVLHLKWSDGTDVAVMLREKAGKTKVVVAHEKEQVSGEVKRLQDYWSAALNRLSEVFSG